MPIDPVVTGARLTRIIAWCTAGVARAPFFILDSNIKQDMTDELAECQAFISSPQWAPWIASLNGEGQK
jgi:hypothetical protein